MSIMHLEEFWTGKNSETRYACGLIGHLPEGHLWIEDHLAAAYLATHPSDEPCPGCFPKGRPQFGTPIGELDGRNGGNAAWRRIARSWGYD